MEKMLPVKGSSDANTFLDHIQEISAAIDLLKKLKTLPHYSRMDDASIMCMIQKARVLGIHPFEAINGGLYAVNGRVEISAQLMSSLIRRRGHRIEKMPESSSTKVTLRGTRSDTGETCIASFSIEDAKRAHLINKGPWSLYPEDMLFARALSRLGRQLFSDCIAGCYVEHEIRWSQPEDSQKEELPEAQAHLTTLQVQEVKELLSQCNPRLVELAYKKLGEDVSSWPADKYETMVAHLRKHILEQESKASEGEVSYA